MRHDGKKPNLNGPSHFGTTTTEKLKDSLLGLTEIIQSPSDPVEAHSAKFERMGWLIILAGVLIRIPFLSLPLTYGSDVWRQADTASIARHFFLNGFNILHPQIYWGGSGPGYVESEFQLYPFLVAVLYWIIGEHLWLGRFVSLLFSIATFKIFHMLARKISSENAAAWSLGFLVISPIFIRYSVAFTPEAIMMFFYVVSLYFFVHWLENNRLLHLVVAAFAVSLAILVKGTPIHIGMVFALLAFSQYQWSALRRWEFWVAAGLSLVAPALWYSYARGLYLTYGNTFGIFSGGDSKFGNFAYWLDPMFYLKVARLEVEWVFAGIGIVGFVLGLYVSSKYRRYSLIRVGFITLLAYYLIVARYAQESWGIQYHIFAIPYAALGVGLGIEWVRATNQKWAKAIITALVIGTLAGSSVLYQRMMSDGGNSLGRKMIQCGTFVNKLVPEGVHIIVSTTSLALEHGIPNNYQEPTIFFYADRYGWSLPADRHSPEFLEDYRKKGAEYFVIYSRELLDANPTLARYLESNATQVGPGVEAGCGIYRFVENRKKDTTF